MDSDENNPGGGSGGNGSKPKPVIVAAKGLWEVDAAAAGIIVTPKGESPTLFGIVLAVHGDADTGGVKVHGTNNVFIRTSLDDLSSWESNAGVTAYCGADQKILLQHGMPSAESSLKIQIDPTSILIDGGMAGTITLSVGQQMIQITPAGITIKGTLVQIN
jgi:hypothetical protein